MCNTVKKVTAFPKTWFKNDLLQNLGDGLGTHSPSPTPGPFKHTVGLGFYPTTLVGVKAALSPCHLCSEEVGLVSSLQFFLCGRYKWFNGIVFFE